MKAKVVSVLLCMAMVTTMAVGCGSSSDSSESTDSSKKESTGGRRWRCGRDRGTDFIPAGGSPGRRRPCAAAQIKILGRNWLRLKVLFPIPSG